MIVVLFKMYNFSVYPRISRSLNRAIGIQLDIRQKWITFLIIFKRYKWIHYFELRLKRLYGQLKTV